MLRKIILFIALFANFVALVIWLVAHIQTNAPPVRDTQVLSVSGYWRFHSKHSSRKYSLWLRNSLKVNTSYVFFYSDPAIMRTMGRIRKELPTAFISLDFGILPSSKAYSHNWTHPRHVPSTSLGQVWTAKPRLLTIASKVFDHPWLAWIDAGLVPFRETPAPASPWPNTDKLERLPRDRIIYTKTNDTDHDFAGTAFMYHREMVQIVDDAFYEQIAICAKEYNDWRCGSDQCIFTELQLRRPELFHAIGQGYGTVVTLLY